MENIILMSDSYKYSQWKQYPNGATKMFSYLEARGGETGKYSQNITQFFGLSYYIKRYLNATITSDMVEEAEMIITSHGLPFNKQGWMRVVEVHDGKLPLKIRAVAEGSVVERRNVLMTIESTDPELFWLVGWAETLLMKIWYPTTVATLGYNIKQLITSFMEKTADTNDKVPFMLHDFGYRGVASEEQAGIGGMSHLVNFMGTDTVAALMYARKYYGADMPGFSIPASEHSTITSWGAGSVNERNGFINMIDQFGKTSDIYACVSDSWDFYSAINTWIELKDQVINAGGQLVIRPDSGDALTNVMYALRNLSSEEAYGYTVNSKGYKVLNNVAIIQGDGVSSDLIYDILSAMENEGFSAQNIAFGMGGALLQGNYESSINRDTHKFAIKCSAIEIDGKTQVVYKDPITDKGKSSKRGYLDLKRIDDNYITVEYDHYPTAEELADSQLVTYFENGEIVKSYLFDEVKSNAN
ncbi:nicotinate phosphoribosyltransferase [Mollicutes bacterium LVI A0078]|nr:nicotinate phosphoribosyltransferase [Mollicutes bacterium LVI A0075]WOO90422.1 nicotinate phosphoribosyltransferase [Mollicutes bacterium LVI A0078]